MNYEYLNKIEAFLSSDVDCITADTFVEEFEEFYKNADAFIAQTVQAATGLYKTAPICSKGCSHCCHQVLIVSYAEAFYLYTILKKSGQWNAYQNEFKVRFHQANAQFDFTQLKHIKANADQTDFTPSIREYNRLGLPCVFLTKNGSCDIYANRPLTCRDAHVFEGDPVDCKTLKNPVVRTILLHETYKLLAGHISEKLCGKSGGGELVQLFLEFDTLDK